MAFNFGERLKGLSYEHNYTYQLRRVLDPFEIRLIEICQDDLDNLRLKSLGDYLVEKAIETNR